MINNLQVLRAFAALNVVMFHIIGIAHVYDHNVVLLAPLSGWGKNGVDIFFVISGFVMGYSQLQNPKPWRQFLLGRIVRIVPIYWLLTFVFVCIYVLAPGLIERVVLTPEYVLSSLLFIAALGFEAPVLDVGWTLEWEMLFYVIFGVCLTIGSARAAIGGAISFMVVLILFLDMWLLLEFIYGLIAALLFLGIKHSKRTSMALFLLGAVGLVAVIFISQPIHRAFVLGIPSFFLVWGAAGLWQTRNQIALYLGASSYSIYLIQVFSIPAFYKIIDLLDLQIQADVLALLCMIVTAIAGCIFYSLVERSITQKLRKTVRTSS